MTHERTLRRALVRPPGRRFAEGLTTAALGAPDLALALSQHDAYRAALGSCGLRVESLAPDDRFPDSTFVEDTAVIVGDLAVLTRPGAVSRRGEVAAIAAALAGHFTKLQAIRPPGTVEGGDVCVTSRGAFIGLTARTNAEGAAQLANLFEDAGLSSRLVDLRGGGLLHLKTELSDLGRGRLLIGPALADRPEFAGFELVRVEAEERYAANAVCLGDKILLPAGRPRVARRLEGLGYDVLSVPLSEFEKMDGGPSCLSLRF